MKIRLIMLILILMTAAVTRAQEADSVTRLVLPNDGSPRIFPSPDGRYVAYERGVRLDGHREFYLCILEIAFNADPACEKMPQQLTRGYEPDANSMIFPFAWSPDSTQIIVTGQPLAAQEDTDISLYTLASKEWRNLNDDRFEGAYPGVLTVEMQPAWSPDGQRIAVEQSIMSANGQTGWTDIGLFNAADGKLKSLGSLSGEAIAGITTGLAWSPDGKTLARSVLHLEQDAEHDGVWLINVADGLSQRLVSLEAIQTALDGVYQGMALKSMGAISWSPDGTKLLLWAGDPGMRPAQMWTFVVDTTTGNITTLPLPAQANDTPEKKSLHPIQAVWSPDSTQVLLMTPGRDRNVDEKPLDPNDDSARVSLYAVSVDGSDMVLIGHLPLGTATGFYVAGWSADGVIVTNGYAIQLK